jgi:hypothetical protein
MKTLLSVMTVIVKPIVTNKIKVTKFLVTASPQS